MSGSMVEAAYALVGIAVGSGGVGSVWLTNRSSRQQQAQALFDRIMTGVRAENEDLREEVEACKKRDARTQVVEVIMRSQLEAMQRIAPCDPSLRHAAHLLKALPVPDHNPEDWKELIARLDQADPDYRSNERGVE